MIKPADIPQDVWQTACCEFDKLYDAEPDLEGGCEFAVTEAIARAILAAEQREREACATVADAVRVRLMAGRMRKRGLNHIDEHVASVADDLAAAIRKRGEANVSTVRKSENQEG